MAQEYLACQSGSPCLSNGLRGRRRDGHSKSDDRFLAVVLVVLVYPPGDCGRAAGNRPSIRLGDGAIECYFHRGNGIQVEDVLARNRWEHKGLSWAYDARGSEGEAVLSAQFADGVYGLEVHPVFALRGSGPPSPSSEGPVPLLLGAPKPSNGRARWELAAGRGQGPPGADRNVGVAPISAFQSGDVRSACGRSPACGTFPRGRGPHKVAFSFGDRVVTFLVR